MSVKPLSPKRNLLSLVTKAACFVVVSCGVATAGDSVLYLLKPDSSFQRGCFPPCLCPVMMTEPVRGTFLLTPSVANGFSTIYNVTEVRWSFTNNGTATSVTGSGTYEVGGQPTAQQELSLYLQIDGGNVEHFDSGSVTNPVSFPDISVSISTNGQFCFDTVFYVNASPTPVPQLNIGLTSTNTVVLTWAVTPCRFVLLESSDMTIANWNNVTNAPTVVGQQNQVILPRGSGNKCYRLQLEGN
jgi:hypothetical protein